MFKKVLVANRGEIAVQIIRSLHEMNSQAVAIYSTADADAYFVQLADEAVCIGGPMPADSYLNMKSIMNAACLLGCDAIHPGYGFLSENAEFASLCAECGITFIGPSAEVIDLMGDKASARSVMIEAGVPVIPGSSTVISELPLAIDQANALGYPVMLKAVAGGGGKGMRVVESEAQLVSHFNEVMREIELSFGSGGVYMEKVIEHAKHIEVQVMVDDDEQVVVFPERDCSLQRRHQKLVEESPSALVTPAERAQLAAVVRDACRQIHYRNAGTLEFLMDADHQFYFMEMNTRLQVEHTITEEVTGVSLIAAQLLVAAHQPLPFTQNDIQIKQFAIECRINTEDPLNDFRPAAGAITKLVLPTGTMGVRIDTAIVGPTTIAPFYDSMVAKLVVSGTDRSSVIKRMIRVLGEFQAVGVPTNQRFLADLLQDDGFQADNSTIDDVETSFLPRWLA